MKVAQPERDIMRVIGSGEYSGFQISELVRTLRHARIGLGFGTLYNALNRLVERKALSAHWVNGKRLYRRFRPLTP